MGADFLAYRVRHQQAQGMEQGQAGQFRVQTVRPARATWFTASLLESETMGGNDNAKAAKPNAKDAGQGAEGPAAYLGTAVGVVMRVAYDSAEHTTAFQPSWQVHIPEPPTSIVAIQREGKTLACGTLDGRVVFLDAGTGANVGPPVIDTGLWPLSSLLWLYVRT